MRIVVIWFAGIMATSACVASGALTHRYTFNDGTARDLIAGADGTPVRGPTFSTGQLVFSPTINNGTNTNPATGQYLDLPNNIARSRAFTLEVWFTWRGGSPWQRIVDFGNNTTNSEIFPADTTTTGYAGQGFIILTPRNAQGNPLAQISLNSHGDPSDTDFSAMTMPLSVNVEHHMDFVHDPDSSQERLYLDGVLVAQDTATVDVSAANYKNYWLGRSQFQTDPFFNGSIDEFRIYNNGLTPAAVQFNEGQGPNGQISDGTGLSVSTDVPEPFGTSILLTAFPILLRRARRFC